MYKFLMIYDIKNKDKRVVSAKYEVIRDFEGFNIDDETENKLVEICQQKNLPSYSYYNEYAIIKYENDKPVSVEGSLYYHEPKDKMPSLLDGAEWDRRVVASVALGVDLTLGKLKVFTREECVYTRFGNNHSKYVNFGVDGEYDCLISIPVTDEVPDCIKEKMNEMLYVKMNEMPEKYYGDFPDPKELDLDARLQINCNHLKGTRYFVSAVITNSDPDVSLFDIFESWDYEVEGGTEIEKQFINYCKSKLNEKFFKENR